jgi:hypothetical protein
MPVTADWCFLNLVSAVRSSPGAPLLAGTRRFAFRASGPGPSDSARSPTSCRRDARPTPRRHGREHLTGTRDALRPPPLPAARRRCVGCTAVATLPAACVVWSVRSRQAPAREGVASSHPGTVGTSDREMLMARVTEWVLGIAGAIAVFFGLVLVFVAEDEYVAFATRRAASGRASSPRGLPQGRQPRRGLRVQPGTYAARSPVGPYQPATNPASDCHRRNDDFAAAHVRDQLRRRKGTSGAVGPDRRRGGPSGARLKRVRWRGDGYRAMARALPLQNLV